MPADYLYHGCAAADILDVLADGLIVGEGRSGVSLTTTAARARWWGRLKGRTVHVLRISPPPADLTPEDAWPADPALDFNSPTSIPPTSIQVYDSHGRRWESLFEHYSEALSDDELAAWQARWLPAPAPSL